MLISSNNTGITVSFVDFNNGHQNQGTIYPVGST